MHISHPIALPIIYAQGSNPTDLLLLFSPGIWVSMHMSCS